MNATENNVQNIPTVFHDIIVLPGEFKGELWSYVIGRIEKLEGEFDFTVSAVNGATAARAVLEKIDTSKYEIKHRLRIF